MKRFEDLTEPEINELLQGSAMLLEKWFPRFDVGRPRFALVVFNDPAIGHYISNCNRADIVKALRELATRLERRETLEETPHDGPEKER